MTNVRSVNLPALTSSNSSSIDLLLQSLNVPRTVLASDSAIQSVWQHLPILLQKIPQQYRGEVLARMCVAIQVGLFDSALNYIWNVGITALREKVRYFGVPAVAHILERDFDERKLSDLLDSELLQLCLDLNLVTEVGHLLLDQSRVMRNNFSAAHPGPFVINEYELLAFANRIADHAIITSSNPKGVDFNQLVNAIHSSTFDEERTEYWQERISGTHEAQRSAILTSLHGIYCDPKVKEHSRVNSLEISIRLLPQMPSKAQSNILEKHHEYVIKNEMDRLNASKNYFTKLGLLNILPEADRHSVVSAAIRRLRSAHLEYNNFHNEPPFAEHLSQIVLNAEVPNSSKALFVETVMMCFIGNGYGVSAAAYPHYQNMIKSFSAREISLMYELIGQPNGRVADLVHSNSNCKIRFGNAARLLAPQSVPASCSKDHLVWTAFKG